MTPLIHVAWPTAAPANAYTAEALAQGAIMVHNQSRDGTNWNDESGNALHAAMVGPAWNASGGPGAAIPGYWHFDGINDYGNAGDETLLRFGGSFALAWWMRRDNDPQSSTYSRHIGKGNTGYMVRNFSDSLGNPQFRIAGLTTDASASWWLDVNAWTMFVATHTATSSFAIYKQNITTGVMELHSQISTSASGQPGVGERFFYGAEDRNDGTVEIRRFWRGDIAGGLAFDKPLTLANMQALCDAGLAA